jgi:hypothetical protein
MTDSTPTSSSGTGAADDSRLTVEDTGSTTDPADLTRDGAADRGASTGAPATAVAAGGSHAVRPGSDDADRTGVADHHDHEGHHHDHDHDHDGHLGHDHHGHEGHDHDHATSGAGGADGLSALQGDDIGHVFDQTNGVIDGLEGDSDGTAASDDASRAERADENSTLDGRDGYVIDRDDR